jgi:hypothetical protein
MSNSVFPASLPGLTYNSIRRPTFNTGLQQALTGKESRIAYQQYSLMEWELQYELLRDYVTPSDLKALVGLFIASKGKWDSFLYVDPVFNSAVSMPFGVTDGTTLSFPVTATYGNSGGPGAPEFIQNFSGTPIFAINRYSQLIEYLVESDRTQFFEQSNNFSDSYQENCTLSSSGFVAPDGVNTVTALIANTSANVQHYLGQNFGALGAGVYTFSIFVLAYGVSGGGDARYFYMQISDGGGGSLSAFFDISEGAGRVVQTYVGTAGNLTGPVAAISPCGNYFRVSLSCTKTGTLAASVFVSPAQSGSGYDYAGTSGIAGAFVWGAQFENCAAYPAYGPGAGGAFPTMYLPTTTATITQPDYSLGPTGIVTITSAHFGAIAGIPLQWSGAFYYRVRFDDDSLDFSQFMQNFWELKKLKLRQVKL